MTDRWNTTDVAWAAGFFEGEGTFQYPPRACLRVLNTDPDPLYRLQAIFGFGNIHGPHPQRGLGTKPYWYWNVSNYEHRQAVVAAMWRWLSPRRREQATRCLAWRQHQRHIIKT